ncbi:MAG TPA: hypothetical protein VKG64_02000 [Methylomirabilota bacterium]|nr:hypothetical protein [Methylomirabilota bacterium]
MPQESLHPWKLTVIVMGLVVGTSLVTGFVVVNWTDPDPVHIAARPRAAGAPTALVAERLALPTREVVAACNRYAAAQVSERGKTEGVARDAADGAAVGAGKGAAIGGGVGAGGGALYGVNENKRRDERYRDAYATCMRSLGYTG